MTATTGSAESPDAPFTTLAGPGTAELKVERSRFLAVAAPAQTETAARACVEAHARRHHDARHVCWAWRGGRGANARELRSDAGEPAGTAGEPCLAALRRAGVTDAVLVVARWFGGVKLGTGGLGRAYGAAADAALAAAPRRTITPGAEHRLHFAYAHEPAVTRLLARHGGRIVAREYAGAVSCRIWLPAAGRDAFAADLIAATGGTAALDPPPA